MFIRLGQPCRACFGHKKAAPTAAFSSIVSVPPLAQERHHWIMFGMWAFAFMTQ
jgi:hypothetical protein